MANPSARCKERLLARDLQETVYMFQPPGFVDSTNPKNVCRLRKSLYGLKQAPRAWYHRFATFIQTCGFKSTNSDTSLFVFQRGTKMAYLLLYVDDIILTASDTTTLRYFIDLLSQEFAMSDLGPIHHFLGIQVHRKNDGLFLTQEQYVLVILNRAKMQDCKPSTTPVDTTSKLSANAGNPLPDSSLYCSLAGALQYLTFTRPDIAYAVQQVCLFMHSPREPHFNFLKRILRYLKGTSSHGLHISPSKSTNLIAYSDADWGGCPDSRRSTSGYCVFLGDNLVSWSSKRQPTISRSSAEAEYKGVANATVETGFAIFFLSFIFHYAKPRSSIATTFQPFTSPRTRCNTNAQNMLKLTSTLFARKCVWVLYVCYMSPLTINMPIFLQRACHDTFSPAFAPTSLSVQLQIRLRGSISRNICHLPYIYFG
ncbi:hypothetical protein L6452_40207 [Arctium lappa]|uniref:Uncharacterized protein n=1 Tax=Arctium lappa TaxID=4217 RepID=A0ACB8XQE3_ARCLA|nr:hypothetical protein L6452_40207 [Arctium lappa]